MKNTETLTLIDGSFTHDEAKEVLLNMFSSKINFHNIKNWSSQERFGKDQEGAQSRIVALNKEIEKLNALLEEAQKNNQKIVVKSEIKITLIDE